MKKLNQAKILNITVAAIVFALFFRVFLAMELYSDDFYYATFFRDGFTAFLEKAKNHFETFNGRNFVHIIIWAALALGREFTALLMTAVLFAIPAGFAKTEGSKNIFPRAAVFAMLLMTVSPVITRESLFWTSGFFNYIFPFLCLISALSLQKEACEKRNTLFYALLCPAQFLLAATTEQVGAATVFATAIFALYEMLYRKKFLPKMLFSPVFGALGLASIFASPATQARFDSEVTGNIIRNTARSFACLGGHMLYGGAFVLVLTFIFISVLFTRKMRQAVRLCGAVCAVAVTAAHIFGGTLAAFLAFGVFCLYAIFCAILCLAEKEKALRGILLLSGIFSVFVISLTSSCEPRTVMPFTLALALFCAVSICENAEMCSAHKIAQIAAKALLCAFCIVMFAPTLSGYLHNEKVREQNLAAIEDSEKLGTLFYSMDYNEKYAHSLMYDDGYFYNTFVSLYRLEDVKIVFTSEHLPDIYCGETKLDCPAIEKDGTLYFPLELTVAALGGSTAWSPAEMQIHIGGKKFSLRESSVYEGENAYDAAGKVRRDFFCILITEDFLRDILGAEISFDEETNAYKISPRRAVPAPDRSPI